MVLVMGGEVPDESNMLPACVLNLGGRVIRGGVPGAKKQYDKFATVF